MLFLYVIQHIEIYKRDTGHVLLACTRFYDERLYISARIQLFCSEIIFAALSSHILRTTPIAVLKENSKLPLSVSKVTCSEQYSLDPYATDSREYTALIPEYCRTIK